MKMRKKKKKIETGEILTKEKFVRALPNTLYIEIPAVCRLKTEINYTYIFTDITSFSITAV